MTSNVDLDLSSMRKQYDDGSILHGLEIQDLGAREPFGVFKQWFDIASNTKSIPEVNAMTLATANKDGKPSVRVVLLKSFSQRGFVWYTNYFSRKGKELEENPCASLLFYWCNMSDARSSWSRQVRVEGRVERLSEAESSQYFHSRPKGSQIGACVSEQSTVIKDRQVLDEKQKELEALYENQTEIPKPPHWGGYLLVPEVVEFWQGRSNRLHDRIAFRKRKPDEQIDTSQTHEGEDGWLIERLSP